MDPRTGWSQSERLGTGSRTGLDQKVTNGGFEYESFSTLIKTFLFRLLFDSRIRRATS